VACLVLGVQARELGEDVGRLVGALLCGRARGQPGAGADRRMRVQRRDPLVARQRRQHCGRRPERVRDPGERLDELRPSLEELGQLLAAQLPR
jgi:hypothetical protein